MFRWEVLNASLGTGEKLFQIGEIKIKKSFFTGRQYKYRAVPFESHRKFWVWVSLGGAIFNMGTFVIINYLVKYGIISNTFVIQDISLTVIIRALGDIIPYKRNGYFSEGMKIYRYIRYSKTGDYRLGEYSDKNAQLREYESIISYCEKKGVVISELPNAYYGKGFILYQSKQYEESISYLDKAIKLKPDLANAYNTKGNSLLGLGRYEEAIDCYTIAVSIEPNGEPYYYNLACSYSLLNNAEEALLYLKKAIELDKIAKSRARTEEDFTNIKGHAQFKELIYS